MRPFGTFLVADFFDFAFLSAIFRRKQIYEGLHPETRQHVAGANAANKAMGNASENSALAFVESTAEATGKSRRAVELAQARGEALGVDITRGV